MTVYAHARPRGLAPWKPQRKNRLLLSQVQEVLDEYAEHLPLTIRQIFYRLVGKHEYPKTENSYDRLQEMLNRARRGRVIPFEAIRDDGVRESRPPGVFDGLPVFWEAVRSTAQNYRLDRQTGQPKFFEFWVEAAGMVPQIERVAHRYGIPVFSGGGSDSTTAKQAASQRIVRRTRPTVVLHVGDMDPSGLSLFDNLAEDVPQFVEDYGGLCEPQFVRVAVTSEQVERYGLPERPPKKTDKRGDWEGGTVQAEALAPPDLATEVKTAIRSRFDLGAYNEVLERETIEREDLLASLGAMLASEPDASV